MIGTRAQRRWISFVVFAAAIIFPAAGSAWAQGKSAIYAGKAVTIGQGSARTVVRTDGNGEPVSISIVFTPGVLDGLPVASKGASPDFPYPLPMPPDGPRTVVDHVVVNWESAGHPPPHVYDVPHFDFHFYLVSPADRLAVAFSSEMDSGDPGQQPPAELVPAGYVLPPGTAVPQMGVHAINPVTSEFHGQPFTATFIYGYYNKRLTFIEPMASLAYLKAKPSFSAPVPRPATYTKAGAYPSTYGIKYDTNNKVYEVTLGDLK